MSSEASWSRVGPDSFVATEVSHGTCNKNQHVVLAPLWCIITVSTISPSFCRVMICNNQQILFPNAWPNTVLFPIPSAPSLSWHIMAMLWDLRQMTLRLELEISRIIFSNYDLHLPGMCQHSATVTSCEVKQ